MNTNEQEITAILKKGETLSSAMPLVSLTAEDLNQLERQRIREAIRRYGGDMTLLPLADEELDAALGLVTTVDGVRHPTISGLLFLGTRKPSDGIFLLMRSHFRYSKAPMFV